MVYTPVPLAAAPPIKLLVIINPLAEVSEATFGVTQIARCVCPPLVVTVAV